MFYKAFVSVERSDMGNFFYNSANNYRRDHRNVCVSVRVCDSDVFKLQHRSSKQLNPSDQSRPTLWGFILRPSSTITITI